MQGIVPLDRAHGNFTYLAKLYNVLPSNIKENIDDYTEYRKTNDVDLLMHPEAILLDEDADTNEDIITALKERYPDIEPGYGQVYVTAYSYRVYDQPGITTIKNDTQIEEICRKHGKVRIYIPYYVPRKESAIVFSGCAGLAYVRYDEKIRKRRIAKIEEKAERPKRNFQFLQEIVKKLLSGTPEQEFLTNQNDTDPHVLLLSKLLKKPSIKFDRTYTVHQRNRMLLEIFLLTRKIDPKPSSENVTTYNEAKERWLRAVRDPRLLDKDSVTVIKMLDDFFQVGNG